jgi:hypothetical protein
LYEVKSYEAITEFLVICIQGMKITVMLETESVDVAVSYWLIALGNGNATNEQHGAVVTLLHLLTHI